MSCQIVTSSKRGAAEAPYSGDYDEQGLRHGRGICVYTDGTVYDGEWARDEQHGSGMCRFPSGNVYFGTFRHGVVEGEGCMLYADGDFFSGTFRNAACHGEGVFFSNGRQTKGVWDRGVRISGREMPLTAITALAAQRSHTAAFTLLMKQFHDHFIFSTKNSRRDSTPGNIVARSDRSSRSVSPSASSRGDDEPVIRTASPAPAPVHPHMSAARPTTDREKGKKIGPCGGEFLNSDDGPALGYAGTLQKASGLGGVSVPTSPSAQSRFFPQADAALMFSFDGGDPGGACETHAPDATVAAQLPLGRWDPAAPPAAASSGVVPREVLFCSAGPVHNEVFSMSSYLKHLGIFLFPFLSLPHIPLCPFAPDTLDVEREFVVSGAALRRDFEVPTASIYAAAVGISCHVVGVALAASVHGVFGRVDGITTADVAVPFAMWIAFAAFCAGYNSYTRLAHPLERLDRHFFPSLAAFVASTVDANSSVCIYTWDEEGGSKITNLHYHYRWQLLSVVVASIIAFASPLTRVARGHSLFGSQSSDEMAACLLCFFSLWIFSGALTYYALKLTDMQREVLAQLRVLTKLAYLRNASITRPTTQIKAKFHFDTAIDFSRPFEGFVGWYFARCHVLYSSTCANHESRGAAVSVMFLLVLLTALISCGDVLYATAAGNIQRSATYYSSGHSIGGAVLLTWGVILLRYMNICLLTQYERHRHRYLVDVAKMFHELHPAHVTSSSLPPSAARSVAVIEHCGAMIDKHDRVASLFSVPVGEGMFALFAFLLACSIASIGVQLGQAIRVSLWR